jgi:hypothetical protein
MRALSADRKIPAMAQAAVALNFNQAADVHLHLFAQIAFHTAFGFNGRAQTRDFLFRQVFDFLGGVHVRFFRERTRTLLPDAVNGRQANPQPLIGRQIHTCDASHSSSPLALALAVLGVDANHAHHSAPMNDLAFHTDLFYRGPNLHFFLRPFCKDKSKSAGLKAPALHLNLNPTAPRYL